MSNLNKSSLIERFNGQEMILFDGTTEKIQQKGNDLFIGNTKILIEVNASNGVVFVIYKVLLPRRKK